MRKIKAAVNPILVFGFFTSGLLAAKKSGYIMGEYASGKYTVIARENTALQAPVGSLLKPFAAWYLLERGVAPGETILCPPERKRTDRLRCWTPAGHGAVSLQTALVYSCNYYFLSRFLGLNLAEYESWLRRNFDWPADLLITKPPHVYGYDLSGGIEAEKLLAMYSALLQAAELKNPHAAIILAGLSQTCKGTLADFCARLEKNKRFRFLAGKTGTVQEARKNFGIVFLYLEHVPDRRKILLLCYEKNKMGSEAALNAVRILHDFDRKKER